MSQFYSRRNCSTAKRPRTDDDPPVFWRRAMSLEDRVASDVRAEQDQESDTKSRIIQLRDELLTRPLPELIAGANLLSSLMYGSSHPDEPSLAPRPKNNLKAREKTAWEKESERRQKAKKSGEFESSSGWGHDRTPVISREINRGCGISPAVSPKPIWVYQPMFISHVPNFLVPNVLSWKVVSGDGNCGFRCVAHIVKGCEELWMDVRGDLCREVQKRCSLYSTMFGPDTTTKIIDSLCHWENIPAPPTHRMVMQDVGFAIANKYSALVVEYGSKQPNTFLPLFFPEGVSELTTEISILYYEPGARFISLTLDDFVLFHLFIQSGYPVKMQVLLIWKN